MEKNKWHAFLFLLPSIFFFVVFSYWPLLQNLYLSFFSWNMVSPNMTFVGIENYTAVLGSEELVPVDLQPAGWPVKHCAFVVRLGIAAMV